MLLIGPTFAGPHTSGLNRCARISLRKLKKYYNYLKRSHSQRRKILFNSKVAEMSSLLAIVFLFTDPTPPWANFIRLKLSLPDL